jgi:predicted Zn-dependent protease
MRGRGRVAAALVLCALGGPAAAPADGEPEALLRAREASWTQRWDESLALYRELVAARPDDDALRLERARVLSWAGRPAEAIPELERVLETRPLSAEVRLELARAYQYSGRVADAVPHYELALPAYADDPAVLAEGASVMRWAGRNDAAARWLAFGLARHPASPDLRVARAASWFDAGRVEKAEAEVRAVLAQQPDHPAGREQLALIEKEQSSPKARAQRLAYAQRYGEARRLLRGWLADHPEDAEAKLMLARFSGWAGDVVEAQEHYRDLLEAQPTDRGLRTEYAEVTSWRGDYTEARRLFEDLVAEEPSDHRPRLDLANIDLWIGDHRAADRQYREILAEDPGHEGAQTQLWHLEQRRAPSVAPQVRWFRDSEDFMLVSPELELGYSPVPGRRIVATLDAPQIRGEEPVVAADGSFGFESRRLSGYGLRVGLTERASRSLECSGELGVASYTHGGASPRAALGVTWFPADRHALLLEGRYQDAVLDVRSIQSGLAGVEYGQLQLVHSWNGERFNAWTQLATGLYSDSRYYVEGTTVLGLRVLRKPSVDVFVHGGFEDFDRPSPLYYSPQNLLSYAGGVRLQHKLFDQLELRLTAELGKIRSREGNGDTLRWAPEIVWEWNEQWHVELIYDHFDSIRSGAYTSDYLGAQVLYRFPVRRMRRPSR